MSEYKEKYLLAQKKIMKYKQKYLALKNKQIGGGIRSWKKLHMPRGSESELSLKNYQLLRFVSTEGEVPSERKAREENEDRTGQLFQPPGPYQIFDSHNELTTNSFAIRRYNTIFNRIFNVENPGSVQLINSRGNGLCGYNSIWIFLNLVFSPFTLTFDQLLESLQINDRVRNYLIAVRPEVVEDDIKATMLDTNTPNIEPHIYYFSEIFKLNFMVLDIENSDGNCNYSSHASNIDSIIVVKKGGHFMLLFNYLGPEERLRTFNQIIENIQNMRSMKGSREIRGQATKLNYISPCKSAGGGGAEICGDYGDLESFLNPGEEGMKKAAAPMGRPAKPIWQAATVDNRPDTFADSKKSSSTETQPKTMDPVQKIVADNEDRLNKQTILTIVSSSDAVPIRREILKLSESLNREIPQVIGSLRTRMAGIQQTQREIAEALRYQFERELEALRAKFERDQKALRDQFERETRDLRDTTAPELEKISSDIRRVQEIEQSLRRSNP